MDKNSNIDCMYCNSTGIRIFIETNNRKKIGICSCVEQICSDCPGDKKFPYVYFNFEKKTTIPCNCQKQRMRLNKIQWGYMKSNIPWKFYYQELSDFKTLTNNPEIKTDISRVLDVCRHFIKGFKENEKNRSNRGLFLYGPTGSGKTMLACAILNELIVKYQVECFYVKISRDFFSRIKSSFHPNSRDWNVFEEVAQKNILVIDDLGIQMDTNWEQGVLYDLIDYRYENEKVTLITSNYEPASFQNIFDGRIYSRFIEMMDFEKIITGFDFREEHFLN